VDPQAAAAESLLTDHRAVESQNRRLPLWPFVTVTAAAILLIVGGWGAVQERNELQQEIAQLKGQLGQKRSDGDLSSAQEASLLAENESMKAQLATLRDEYAQLANEISSLQNRLMADVDAGENQARVAATAETAAGPAATEVTTPAPAATSEPAYEATENETDLSEDSEQDIVALTGTTWFVNVASHSNRELAATWRDRIAKRYEGVRIQEADVNGRSLFRVRVLGFSSKAAAERARRQLEQDFGIGPLWVGSMTETTNDVTEVKTAVPATRDASPKEPKLEPAIASIAAPTSKVEAPQVSGDTAPPSATQQALELQPINSDGGWFIYVDTFSQPAAADERAKQITAAGYDAKVAVEYRTGEMFYRVQVVGIKSRMQGEAVVAKLASLDDMPNLQLRQY
jgi:cell division septation protein DedD